MHNTRRHGATQQQGGGGASPAVTSPENTAAGRSPTHHHKSQQSHAQQHQQRHHQQQQRCPQRTVSASAAAGVRGEGRELETGADSTSRREAGNPASPSGAIGAPFPQQHFYQQYQYQASMQQPRRRRDPLARPTLALSSHLMTVYKNINVKFCSERRLAVPGPKFNGGYDDGDGHYIPIIGEEISGRYMVQEIIGRGSFGVVLRCQDNKYLELVALKVVRRGDMFMDQGRYEAEMVSYLNQNSLLTNFVVKLFKAFIWKQHIVIVLELLSCDLFKLIQMTNYNGVSLDLTRKFGYQLLTVLQQLGQHQPPIIHCDIKPENVLLRNPRRSGIQVGDFGSSCYQQRAEWELPPPLSPLSSPRDSAFPRVKAGDTRRNDVSSSAAETKTAAPTAQDSVDGGVYSTGLSGGWGPPPPPPVAGAGGAYNTTGEPALPVPMPPMMGMSKYIQSRFYRSPEVILELGYTAAIDRWSLGCMLAEMHTGTPLFPGRTEVEMIGLFTVLLGPIPDEMIAASPKRQLFFERAPGARQGRRHPDPSGSPVPDGQPTPPEGGADTTMAVTRPAEATATTAATDGGQQQRQDHRHRSGGAAQRGPPASAAHPSDRRAMDRQRGRPATAGCAVVTQHDRAASPLGGPAAADGGRADLGSRQKRDVGTSPPSLPATAGFTTTAAEASSIYVPRFVPDTTKFRPLVETLGVYSGGPRGCRRGQAGHDSAAYEHFLHFIRGLLAYDPRERLSCEDASKHPFMLPLMSDLSVSQQQHQ